MFFKGSQSEANQLFGLVVRFKPVSATEIDKDAQRFHKDFMAQDGASLYNDCKDLSTGLRVHAGSIVLRIYV